MAVFTKKKKPGMVSLSNDEMKLYRLKLTSGIEVEIRASHLSSTETMHLFMRRRLTDCFVEIPKAAVRELQTMPLTDEYSELRTEYTPELKKYQVTFPDDQIAFVIASDDEWEGDDAKFFCQGIPLMKIFKARGCEFNFSLW